MSDHETSSSPRIPQPDHHQDLHPPPPPPNDQDPTDQHHHPPAAAAAAAPPPFEPLFTLLTNTTTNTTIHPRVRYIFADDDPSLLLSGPEPEDPHHRALVVDLTPAAANPSSSSSSSSPIPPPPNDEAAAATTRGEWSVSWASSLTPDFAVTQSSISVVQQGDRDDGSVMLQIDGVEREVVAPGQPSNTASPSNSTGSGLVGKDDADALVEDFRRRMGVLKKVVGQGERRREALDRLHQHEDSEGIPEGESPGQQPQLEGGGGEARTGLQGSEGRITGHHPQGTAGG